MSDSGKPSSAIRELIARPARRVRELHARHINPTFVEAMGIFGCGRDYVRAEGVQLWDAEGREYIDFLSGFGAVPLGQNHPDVKAAVAEVLGSSILHFPLVTPGPLAASLAERLAQLAPHDLTMAYFGSSGSEAVEGALKLARAASRRERFVFAERAYHGTTLGALSVTGDAHHRAPFEPLLPGTTSVPWGDTGAIERELRRRDVAAVVLEPIQGEGGIRLPPSGYLADVSRLCRRFGTLLVLDEVQTGLGRTGRLFACEDEAVEPDVLCLAKGLSGGIAPIGAYLTRPDLWKRAYGVLGRHELHCSTFSGAPLSCAAALATLEVIVTNGLAQRAGELGRRFGDRLRAATKGHRLVRDVRGRGFLWGIELAAPAGIGRELVGQWAVAGMVERGIVTQVCGQAPDVLRAQPPLVAEPHHLEAFVTALTGMLEEHARTPLGALAAGAGRLLRHGLAGLGGTQ